MNAPALVAAGLAPSSSEVEWRIITAQAPGLAATSGRYLDQISHSLRPGSVTVADATLRIFCRYLIDEHPDATTFARVGRTEIEGFKTALGARVTRKGTLVSPNYRRQRLGTLRTFFDRMIEWDWPDAPARTPIFAADLPRPDEPLPKFLDDGDATRLARAIAAEPDRCAVSSWNCCPTPECASVSCAPSSPTPSSRSATAGGCGSHSGSSTTTATSRSCPNSSRSSMPGGPATTTAAPACC